MAGEERPDLEAVGVRELGYLLEEPLDALEARRRQSAAVRFAPVTVRPPPATRNSRPQTRTPTRDCGPSKSLCATPNHPYGREKCRASASRLLPITLCSEIVQDNALQACRWLTRTATASQMLRTARQQSSFRHSAWPSRAAKRETDSLRWVEAEQPGHESRRNREFPVEIQAETPWPAEAQVSAQRRTTAGDEASGNEHRTGARAVGGHPPDVALPLRTLARERVEHRAVVQPLDLVVDAPRLGQDGFAYRSRGPAPRCSSDPARDCRAGSCRRRGCGQERYSGIRRPSGPTSSCARKCCP